jgi:hypothetical protein
MAFPCVRTDYRREYFGLLQARRSCDRSGPHMPGGRRYGVGVLDAVGIVLMSSGGVLLFAGWMMTPVGERSGDSTESSAESGSTITVRVLVEVSLGRR